jgi:hypothetical protein
MYGFIAAGCARRVPSGMRWRQRSIKLLGRAGFVEPMDELAAVDETASVEDPLEVVLCLPLSQ